MSKETKEEICGIYGTNSRKVCFSIVSAAFCVIMSAVLHLVGFKELGIYCTISGAVFLIIAWFWIMKGIRQI